MAGGNITQRVMTTGGRLPLHARTGGSTGPKSGYDPNRLQTMTHDRPETTAPALVWVPTTAIPSLGQFSVTFEYRPGSQHANADGMSRQCGQCRQPDCPVSAADLPAADADTQSLLVDQPFASSEMGDSMDSDLLPELSGETWVASALLEELTVDLPTAGSDIDLVAASREDNTLQTVRSWVQSGNAPAWPACAGLSPELRCWRLQVGNLTIDSVGRLWRRRLVVPV